MSPQEMAARLRCQVDCPVCAAHRRQARLKVRALIVLGSVLVGLSFLAEGLLGIALALAGIAVNVAAIRLIRREAGR